MAKSGSEKPENPKVKATPKNSLSNRAFKVGSLLGVIALVIFLAFFISGVKRKTEIAVCLNCHLEYSKMTSLPFVHNAFKNESCQRCHTVHGEDKIKVTFTRYIDIIWKILIGIEPKGTTTFKSKKTGKRPKDISKLVKAEKKLCNSCHSSDKFESWKTAKYKHPPYKEGVCTSCHDAHASKHQGVTRGKPSKLCPSCHRIADWMSKEVLHPPFKLKNCADCHDPHATNVEFHLRAEQKILCTSCHKKIADLFRLKYKMEPFEKGQCTKCHNPHSSNYQKLWQEGPEAEDLCFSCHDGSNGVSNIKKFKTMSYQIKPFSKGKCLECHKPHATSGPKLLKGKGNDFCFKCHGNYKKNYLPIGHNKKAKFNKDSPNDPAHGKGSCLNCHVPHGSKWFGLVYKEIISLCTTCHDKNVFRGYKRDVKKPHIAHPVGLNITDPWRGNYLRCSSCHNPMGSGIKKLKRKRDDDLCIQCHNIDDPTWIRGRNKT